MCSPEKKHIKITIIIIIINERHEGGLRCCTSTHIVELLYELRLRVVCYPKIKFNPRVLGIWFILCCAWNDAFILNYVYIYI